MEELDILSIENINGGSRGDGIYICVNGVVAVATGVAGGTVAAPLIIAGGCFAIGYGIGKIIKG